MASSCHVNTTAPGSTQDQMDTHVIRTTFASDGFKSWPMCQRLLLGKLKLSWVHLVPLWPQIQLLTRTNHSPDVVQCSVAPPKSSALTSSPVAAFTRGGPPKKIVPLSATPEHRQQDLLRSVVWIMSATEAACQAPPVVCLHWAGTAAGYAAMATQPTPTASGMAQCCVLESSTPEAAESFVSRSSPGQGAPGVNGSGALHRNAKHSGDQQHNLTQDSRQLAIKYQTALLCMTNLEMFHLSHQLCLVLISTMQHPHHRHPFA